MDCPQCLMSIIDVEAKFCPHCGEDLVKHRVELQKELLKKANETQPELIEEFTETSATPGEAVTLNDREPNSFVYAGFWIRAVALLIDAVLLQALYFITLAPFVIVIGILAANIPPLVAMQIGVVFVVTLAALLQWMWFTIGESSAWQATPGKKILGLKVARVDGERVSFGTANKRYWSRIASTLPAFAGYLMVGVSAKKQGIHDRIAKTVVVKS